MKDLQTEENRGCRTWEKGECVECSIKWYFDDEGVCREVNDYCRTWNYNGECLTCYRGWVVKSGKCEVDGNMFLPDEDSLCAEWDRELCL